MVDGLTPSVSFALVETRYQGKPFTSEYINPSMNFCSTDQVHILVEPSDYSYWNYNTGHSDCNPDPSYTQRACENGQIMERILNYCDCFPSYDKQFEKYMEMKNLTARACNFFEHVRKGFY